MSGFHGEQTTTDGLHVLTRWEYASTAARDAASYTAADEGGVARVGAAAPWAFYTLSDASGPTWIQIGAGGGGEANTASNVNTAGVGVFKQKTGVDLEFRGVNAASAKATIVLDAPTNEIRVDVADASATQAGAIEIATQGEVDTGTDTTRAIVPSTLSGSALASDVGANTAKVTNATHSGDATGATALTIAANVVSNSKLADVATATIKGRVTASTGDPEDLTSVEATSILEPFTDALKGLAPASGGGTANFLRADSTWASPPGVGEANTASNVNTSGVGVFKQKTGVDLEFRGLVAASTKATIVLDAPTNEIRVDVADASEAQAGAIEIATQTEVDTGTDTTRAIVPSTLSGSTLASDVSANTAKVSNATHTGDATGATALTIAANVVSNAKLADVASGSIKGRVTAATGDPEDLTGTEATTLLDQFTVALQGVVPASGGGATNFLRADRVWAAPPGGGGAVWTVATEATAARSATSGEFVLVSASTCVITLPAPVADSRVAVKAIASTVTSIEIRTSGAGILIDGTDYSATGLALKKQYEMVNVISDGTDWFIY